MRKLRPTTLLMTLLAGSLLISGCAQPLATQMPKAPVKPTLSDVKSVGGLVCFPSRDASALGLYILSLERGYR